MRDYPSHERPLSIQDWKGSGLVNVHGLPWAKVAERAGAGHTAVNEEVFYFGAMALLPASEFLRLALPFETDAGPRRKSTDFLYDQLSAGKPVSPPFLTITRSDGETCVEGHEGRHRALAVIALTGDENQPIPVALIGRRELRARHLSQADFAEWTTGAGVVPEEGVLAQRAQFLAFYHESGVFHLQHGELSTTYEAPAIPSTSPAP